MENPKIINDILNEWAMRSHDGLVSGHNTPENFGILSEILSEYGLTDEQIKETTDGVYIEAKEPKSKDSAYLFAIKDPTTKTKTKLVSYGHPDQQKYPDGEIYDGPHELPIEKYKTANKENINNAKAAAETDPIFKALRDVKGVSIDNVRKLKEVFESFKDVNVVASFKDKYDTINSIQDAIIIYEGRKYPEFQGLINKIDDTRFAGAGRGELPFVFLLKGATSGGNREVDILFAEADVEVKEISNASIAISAPTLPGFSNSKFNVAIHELALAVNKIKGFKEFLLKVLEDNGDLYSQISNPSIEKHKEAITKFFADPKVGEVSYYLLDAIFIISTKIVEKKSSGRKDSPKATIDVDVGEKHREFKVPDSSVSNLSAQLNKISKGSAPTKIDVDIAYTDEDADEYIAQQAMKLSFFKENWDKERVQEEIIGLISKKYTKLLIIDKSKGNKAILFGPPEINSLEFYALGFGKIHMLVPGMGGSKTQAVKDIGKPAEA
jgi:hypothetical protein